MIYTENPGTDVRMSAILASAGRRIDAATDWRPEPSCSPGLFMRALPDLVIRFRAGRLAPRERDGVLLLLSGMAGATQLSVLVEMSKKCPDFLDDLMSDGTAMRGRTARTNLYLSLGLMVRDATLADMFSDARMDRARNILMRHRNEEALS